jgi:hypothetical protein
MKKIFLALAMLAVAGVGASTAHAGVSFSIGIPAPVVTYRPPVYYAAPRVVYVPSAPVYYAAAPVYCAPAPAYCAPPRVYCPPPVCYAPAPVVRFGFGFGHNYRHGRW